jgi:hypothetical protein
MGCARLEGIGLDRRGRSPVATRGLRPEARGLHLALDFGRPGRIDRAREERRARDAGEREEAGVGGAELHARVASRGSIAARGFLDTTRRKSNIRAMMKSSIRPVLLAAALAAGGCGLTPTIPDASELAAARKAGLTYETYARGADYGDSWWYRRAEGEQAVRNAITWWETAYAVDPRSRDICQKLSLACYYLANYFTPDKAEREKVHLRGQGYGVAAARLNPDIRKAMDVDGLTLEEAIRDHAAPGDVPGLYWMTVNAARAAENKSIATRAAVAPKLKSNMETIYRLGPKYYWGGVHRFFGAYYIKAPAQKDPLEQSKREFDLAMTEGSDNLENFVLAAEFWAKAKNDREAYEKLLKHVLDTPPEKDIQDLKLDNAEARKRAKKMLENIDEDF